MRYIGIDYGGKRIGIAISDEAGIFAFPKETIPNDDSSIDRIGKLAEKERVGAFVFGDTLADTGAANTITDEAMGFVKALAAHTKLPIHQVREAWSSSEAARFAPDGVKRDDVAAAIILQRFLDVHKDDSA